ncbi:hypothetical protein ABZ814_22755 [Micromonospora musae]|uniref:hypothetical protein n=1 Tax=Micromonospora musae TaxID=1894970 RepID=UPI0033DCB101
MSTQTHTCLTIHCDGQGCNASLGSDYVIHVASLDGAQLWADDEGWRFIGDQQFCGLCIYNPHQYIAGSYGCVRCDLDEDAHETAEAVTR